MLTISAKHAEQHAPQLGLLSITDHAKARIQQRGIPPLVLETLLDFGQEIHDHHGGRVYYFDQESRLEIRNQLDASVFKKIESSLDAYAVVSNDGTVVTVGHRFRRIIHN